MISRLRGRLLEKNPPAVLVDVQGVGYEVFVPMTTFYLLPGIGEEVVLHTHFVVREDAQQLYGFGDARDRELFCTVLKVSGVGPKLGLAIFSGMESAELLRCIQDNNIKALSQVPGIGKKTAERLVMELRDTLAKWDDDCASLGKSAAAPRPVDHLTEAESALIALGYKPAEAAKRVSDAAKTRPEASSEELIRLALKSALSG